MDREALLQRAARLEAYVLQDPQNLDLRRDLISSYHRAGEQEKARHALLEAQRLFGVSPDMLNMSGHIALARGDWGEAAAAFKAITSNHDAPSEAHFNLGFALLAQGLAEDALQALDAAVAANPSNSRFQQIRAEALSVLGNNVEALNAYGLALESDERNLDAQEGLAFTALDLGEMRLAHDMAKLATSTHPDSARAWALKGQVELLEMDVVAASKALRQALDLAPDDAEIKASLAQSYLMLGLPKKVIGLYGANSGQDLSAESTVLLAWAHVLTGQLDLASSMLRNSVDHDASDADSMALLALCRLAGGDVSEASGLVQRALSVDGDCFLASVLSARIAEASGDESAARAAMEDLLSGNAFGSLYGSNAQALASAGASVAMNRFRKRERRVRMNKSVH